MIRYAQSHHCRMSSLVRHFGDLEDGRNNCGICDFCAPESCVAQKFRPASDAEQRVANLLIDALQGGVRPVGRLHAELGGALSRDAFEELLGALARAGLVRLAEAVFEKDGKQIPYRKASLTRDAAFLDRDQPLELTIRDAVPAPDRGVRKKKTTKKKTREKAAVRMKAAASPQTARVEQMLRSWRTSLAKRQHVPPFIIMSDRTLLAIAENQPRSAAELLAIPGIGIAAVEKYGAQIYRILGEASSRA
jgi:superfamily II DNA helicase RecQ